MPKTDSDIDTRGRPSPSPLSQKPDLSRPLVPSGEQPKLAGAGVMSRDVQADPRLEYVAGGGYLWLNHYLRSLPFYIDDVTEDFGDDLYERMLKGDPEVSAAFKTLKQGVLQKDITLLPAEDMADRAQPAPSFGKGPRQSSDQAWDVCDFCRRALDRVSIRSGRPIELICYELLDGMAYGSKVAEIVYDIPETGPDAGLFTLSAIKPKPRGSTAFVVDSYSNVIGLLGLVPGQGYPTIVEGIMGNLKEIPNLLPREKFAVLTYDGKDGDPRGSSCLRAAYNCWYLKMQFWGEYLKFITQFGSPVPVGTTADGAIPYQMKDAQGNGVVDVNGNPVMVTPEQAQVQMISSWRAGSGISMPFGADLKLLESRGDGAVFTEAFALCNSEIRKAILLNTLATGEAKHDTRAASETHMDVMSLPIRFGRMGLTSALVRDVLTNIIKYTYGPEFVALMPVVSIGGIEQSDFAEDGKTVAALQTAGYFDDSQLDGVDARLGLPARADGWIERKASQQQMNDQAKSLVSDRSSDADTG